MKLRSKYFCHGKQKKSWFLYFYILAKKKLILFLKFLRTKIWEQFQLFVQDFQIICKKNIFILKKKTFFQDFQIFIFFRDFQKMSTFFKYFQIFIFSRFSDFHNFQVFLEGECWSKMFNVFRFSNVSFLFLHDGSTRRKTHFFIFREMMI